MSNRQCVSPHTLIIIFTPCNQGLGWCLFLVYSSLTRAVAHCLASLNFTSNLILIKFKLSTSQVVVIPSLSSFHFQETDFQAPFGQISTVAVLTRGPDSARVCSNWVYLSYLNLPIQAVSSTTLNQYSRQVYHQTNNETSLDFSISNNLTSKTRTQVSHPSNILSFFQQTTNW